MVSKHGLVMKHSVEPAYGPEILSGPTLKLYIVSWAQHMWYMLVAKPADAVPKLNVAVVADAVPSTPVAETSKVCPVYGEGTDAAVPHTALLACTRALFDAFSPAPVTWTMHGTVIGQLITMVSGPLRVKTPISNA
jgi:hypothetical protein